MTDQQLDPYADFEETLPAGEAVDKVLPTSQTDAPRPELRVSVLDPGADISEPPTAIFSPALDPAAVTDPLGAVEPAVFAAFDGPGAAGGLGEFQGEVSPDGTWIWSGTSWIPNPAANGPIAEAPSLGAAAASDGVAGHAGSVSALARSLPGLRRSKAPSTAASTTASPVRVSVVSGGAEVDEKGKKLKPANTGARGGAGKPNPLAGPLAALSAALGPVLVVAALVLIVGLAAGAGIGKALDTHGDEIESLSAALAEQQALAASLQQSAGQATIDATTASNDLDEATARADLAEAQLAEEKTRRKDTESQLDVTSEDLEKSQEALKLAEKSVEQAQADLSAAVIRLDYCTDAVTGLSESVDWLTKAVEAALDGDTDLATSYVGRAQEGQAQAPIDSCRNASLGVPFGTDSTGTDATSTDSTSSSMG